MKPKIEKITKRAPTAIKAYIMANFASLTEEIKRVLVPIVTEQTIAAMPRRRVVTVEKPMQALRQPMGRHMRELLIKFSDDIYEI